MIFLTCILLFMSIESAEAMQRSREDITKRSAFSLLAPYPELQLVILEKVQVPKTHLRLVCKMSYEFCEKKNDKMWFFTNENYPSFRQEMGKPWVESLLKNLPSLSFHNSIEESALNEPDDLEVEAWEKKYVFVSNEELEYIKKYTLSLRELQFYNVPSLKTALPPQKLDRN